MVWVAILVTINTFTLTSTSELFYPYSSAYNSKEACERGLKILLNKRVDESYEHIKVAGRCSRENLRSTLQDVNE